MTNALASDLISLINSRKASVAILGLGYVGLPLAFAFHEAGLHVLGFDIDQAKVDDLNAGRNYLVHLSGDIASALAASGRFTATSDPKHLARADVHIVCVPTPIGAHHEPDLSYVLGTARTIGANLKPSGPSLVVLESSTYPGTTRDELIPALLAAAESAGRKPVVGHDLLVAFSPEREDPGRKEHTTRSIPKLVGGVDAASLDAACALYRTAIERVIPVSSAEVAEAAKLLENIFRAVNIALANETKMVLDAMGIDVWEVIQAAATKPFGFMPFYPGPGLGGHCIPVDPFYLSWKAKEVGVPARFIELSGEINHAMPAYVVSRLVRAFNDRARPVKGSKILVMGLAYKPDVADVRESPSFELITQLLGLGAEVSYADPLVPVAPPMRRWDVELTAIEPTPQAIAAHDCVLISTAHSAFDYAAIATHARLVVDTRNAMRPFAEAMGDRLVRA